MPFKFIMDPLLRETWLFLVTALMGVISYWARSTKKTLEEKDAHLEQELEKKHNTLSTRLHYVEDAIGENKIMLTEIKGDIRVLSSELCSYRKDKHDIENDNAGLRSSLVEVTDALKTAERVLNLTKNAKN